MKKILSAGIVFIFCFLFISCKSKDKGGSGPAYTLKMRLAIGDKFGQDIDMKMNMSVAGLKTDMKMNSTVDMEVMGDTADFKRLRVTTTKAKMSMDRKGQPNTRIDTLIDKYADIHEGKSTSILLNKNNEIVDVTGFDERMTGAYKNNPVMQEVMKKMFSKDHLNSMMGLMFQMYPDHPVRVGDTWEKESDVSMGPLKARMKYIYKLKEVNNGVAIIQVENKYKGKGKMEQGGMDIDMDMDMDGKSNGEITVGIDDGYFKSYDYTMDFKAKTKIMGQTVPYDIHSSYQMKGH